MKILCSSKGVRLRMFCLIIYSLCFDPRVLFCCRLFFSVSSSNFGPTALKMFE